MIETTHRITAERTIEDEVIATANDVQKLKNHIKQQLKRDLLHQLEKVVDETEKYEIEFDYRKEDGDLRLVKTFIGILRVNVIRRG